MDIARKKLVESQSNGKNRIITVNTWIGISAR
jgi:hypothetical protein